MTTTDLGCGQVAHDGDCFCDLAIPVGPAAPAANVDAAILEIAEMWNTEPVKTDDAIRAGLGHAAVSRLSGLDPDRVKRRRELLGLPTHRSQGGGNIYAVEQYAAVLNLRGEGHSYTEIATRTSVPRNAVIGICRRRKA